VVLFGHLWARNDATHRGFHRRVRGEDREVFAHFYTSSGYLIASKDYANKLA